MRFPGTSVVIAALAVALAVASCDVMVAMARSPESWGNWAEVAAPSGVVAVLGLIGFLVFWYSIARPLGRKTELREEALLPAAAVFSLALFAVLSAQDLLRVDVIEPKRLLSLTLALAACVGLAEGVYRLVISRRWGPIWERNGAAIAGLSAVATMAVLVAVSSFHRYNLVPLLVSACTLLAAAAVLWRVRSSRARSAVVLGGLFALVVGAAIAGHFGRRDFEVGQADGPVSGVSRKIRRVILISADSLRADALSIYGEDGVAVPNLERLAADSVVYRNAYSPAAWTLPSAVSLITGLPTHAHQVLWVDSPLPPEIPTLAEVMGAAGYATAAVVENPVLDPRLNLYQGFQEFAHFPKAWPWSGDSVGRRLLAAGLPSDYYRGGTEALTRTATTWLEANQNRDFFLWIHYLDPHAPYSPPARFVPEGKAPPSMGNSFDEHVEVVAGTRMLNTAEREWIRRLYLGEVRYVDEQIGMLLDTLKRLGLYEDSMIVFTSDHGEEFWEHGAYQHGHSMYNEVLAVPLVVKAPQSTQAGDVFTRVSTQFVMPTILAACGIATPEKCYSAPTLPAATRTEQEGSKGVLLQAGSCYQEDIEAVIFRDHKLIRRLGSGREELFNLTLDPAERKSLMERRPELAEIGRRTLQREGEQLRLVRACLKATTMPAPAGSAERLRQLRTLGYVN